MFVMHLGANSAFLYQMVQNILYAKLCAAFHGTLCTSQIHKIYSFWVLCTPAPMKVKFGMEVDFRAKFHLHQCVAAVG